MDMRELDAIISQYKILKAQEIDSVLATVVHVEGSSYRRAGARMLIDEFGNITGAISGGCLEGDALKKALHALHQRKNKLVTYDTTDEDDAVIGAQLGCNGIIQVLFEPLEYGNTLNPCELLAEVIKQKGSIAIIIEFNLNKTKEQQGTRYFISEDYEVFGKRHPDDLPANLLEQVRLSLANKISHFAEVFMRGENRHFFVQNYQPPVKLVLVGAGNDVLVLAQQAEILGWNVVVTDGRPSHANENRFPGACQVIVTKPEETLEKVEINNRTAFVLMSHNYNYDLAVLKLLLAEKKIFYIGVLGPLKKYQRMLKDMEEKDLDLEKQIFDKIYAPVGLEIGAETPAEIGLSILAEIQAVLNGKSAKPLREKDSPIHDKRDNQFKQVQV